MINEQGLEQGLIDKSISPSKPRNIRWFILFIATMGPGLTAMLADTDAGSIITAAQSGALWGYRLLILQVILIPILYFVQELTIRIGIATQRGHGDLIRETFGAKWAWISVSTLLLAALGALVTEFSGIAGISILFGVPPWVTVPFVAMFLILITSTGKYKVVERIAIFVGLFELAFIPLAIFAKPDSTAILHAFIGNQLFKSNSYWLLVAANVGAVIMPWMIFYQQGAVVDKCLSPKVIKYSRIETAIGSIATQVIMGCVLIFTAATIGKTNSNAPLENVQQIAIALTPFLGSVMGKILFAVGLTGAALVAAIVVSLATSWAFGEVLKVPCSLNNTWKEAPVFYGLYAGALILASTIVLVGIPLISLTIAVEVMNSLLLPIVLGFLLVLGWKVLPKDYQLKIWEKVVLVFIYVLVCSLGIFTLVQFF
jgi:NRAMP (natural resistance-associated macrophage protein)-like metal ion transporter